MDVADFDFILPPELIAENPPERRGESRLLVLRRDTGDVSHHSFAELPGLLDPGDLIVINDTRVFPARLLGVRLPGGGAAECFLVRPLGDDVWECLVHPGQRLKEGSRMRFEGNGQVLEAEVLDRRFHGRRGVRFFVSEGTSFDAVVDKLGHVPLPPYIKRQDRPEDKERYQTVYARARGSIAAPTAGLHFTPAILDALDARGVGRAAITLHVGYGTFQPVRVSRVEDHAVEPEHYDVSEAAARAIDAARAEGRRIVAVGTTTVRTLETLAAGGGPTPVGPGETSLFVHPGHVFGAVGALVTNFHLPRSSLLMLVSAFAGRERVLEAYRQAVAAQYRFYSFGDAMLVL